MVMPCSRSARSPSVTKREVHLADARGAATPRDRLELVVEELAGVEEQPPDQGRLAVVDRADGGESQEVDAAGARRSSVGRAGWSTGAIA